MATGRDHKIPLPALGAALLILGLGLGYLGAPLTAPDRPAAPVICRPSAPDIAVTPDRPVVLFLGNSLVFDHDWPIPGIQPVNCAAQGMIAADLDPARLPDLAPDLIVLGFGTVEAIRAAQSGTQPDATRLSDTLRDHIAALTARYSGADIAILGLPPLPAHPDVALGPLNTALTAVATETNAHWMPLDTARPYDGIHLSDADYRPWHTDIAALLAERTN